MFSNATWFLAHDNPLEDNNCNGKSRPTAVRSEVLGVPAVGGDAGLRSSQGGQRGCHWDCPEAAGNGSDAVSMWHRCYSAELVMFHPKLSL